VTDIPPLFRFPFTQYVKEQEPTPLPSLVCEAMNKNVRAKLSEAIDGYIAYRREQTIKSLEVLRNLAEAGWDVRPALRALV